MSERISNIHLDKKIFQIQDLNSKKFIGKLKANGNSIFPCPVAYFSYKTPNKPKEIRRIILNSDQKFCFNETNLELSKNSNYLDNNNLKRGNISSDNNIHSSWNSYSNEKSRQKAVKNSYYKNSYFAKKIKLYLNRTTETVKPIKRYYNKNYINFNYDIDPMINNQKSKINKLFMVYIDNINADKSNISKYKKELYNYFDNNSNENISSYFNDLVKNNKFINNYLSSDSNSTKRNNFIIKNLNISFKLSSLKLMFYEIMHNKEYNIETYNNIDNNNTNKTKNKMNSKIKFPFQFLPLFYGLNFEDFLNLLISYIDYDFDKNKFYLNCNNFITNTEEAKIIYEIYNKNSFIYTNNSNNEKEYFLYDWEIKGKNNETKHFCIKIILPQMEIRVKNQENNKIKFYSYVNHNTIYNLIKNDFNKWDFYILVYFSQYKIFRNEINKIISRNCSNFKLLKIIKQMKPDQNLSFNLTNSCILINTNKKNHNSNNFFYTYLKEGKIETYYITFKLPNIDITYHSFNKNFNVGFRRLRQLNKLRKYFLQEDIIKYSMIIDTYKEKTKNIETKIPKIKNEKKIIKAKTTKFITRNSSISIGKKNDNRKLFFMNDSLTNNKKNNLKCILRENEEFREVITDIKLNLDKYIFNFDESVLNSSNIKDFNKTYTEGCHKISVNNNAFDYNNNEKLSINLDTLEISLTNREGLKIKYKFNKKISQYLLDHSRNKWKSYIINNIEKIIMGTSL